MNIQKRRDDDISFALVTRLQRSEVPFLNEFLSYYKLLGINRFYLVSTEPENSEFIATGVAPEYREMVEHIDKNPEDTLNECPNYALSQIEETFLLHVDMDEFLYLNGMTLHEFIIAEELQGDRAEFVECFFQWIMSPLCQELHAPSIGDILKKGYFFPSVNGKSLARTQDIIGMKSHHFELAGAKKERRYNSQTSNCFVFHMSARGIFDIVNKVQFGKFMDVKRSSDSAAELSDLIFNTTSKTLPPRFLLLAFQSKFTPHIVTPNFEYPELEHKTDTDLLREMTLDGLTDLLDVEIVEEDLERVISDKINRYAIPPELVNSYAEGKTNLLTVLRHLQGKKPVVRWGFNKPGFISFIQAQTPFLG